MVNLDAARIAIEGLERKMEQAVDAAWKQGLDFVRSKERIIDDPLSNPFNFRLNIFAPGKVTISYKGAAMEREDAERYREDPEYIVFWCPDDPRERDVATYTAIHTKRCGYSIDTVRRVVLDHGTCSFGGCPHGGDL